MVDRFEEVVMNADTGLARPSLPVVTAEDVCRIFRSVLDVDEVREDDNFFELGGYSLLAVVLVGVLEQEIGVRLPPEIVLRVQTPRGVLGTLNDATDRSQ